ncbi:hypothetical protein [Ruminococcus sp.]|uniref:hypothetical protein n=1 Tax=Ruminococcus sp. TaxID=41978 RepID=UPI002600C8BF|nr:hypothetical protein [Ruminococcus sp.]MBQ8965784.1 hypothetical protein [Ruminococcus sp.]
MKHKLLISCALGAMLAVSMMLGGCGSEYNSREHIDAALAHMNEKYGTKFTFQKSSTKPASGGVFGNDGDFVNIHVTTGDLPGKSIQVFSPDGEKYLDDYICMKYEDQATADITALADSIYDGDVPVVVVFSANSSSRSSKDLPADTDYEGMLMSGAMDHVQICVDDRDDEVNKYRTLVQQMMDKGINCAPIVYHFTDDVYKEVDSEYSAQSVASKHLEKSCGTIELSGFAPILDEGFDGKLQIMGDGVMQTEADLVPAADETEETFAEYFMTRGELEEMQRSSLSDISFEPVSSPDISMPDMSEAADYSDS